MCTNVCTTLYTYVLSMYICLVYMNYIYVCMYVCMYVCSMYQPWRAGSHHRWPPSHRASQSTTSTPFRKLTITFTNLKFKLKIVITLFLIFNNSIVRITFWSPRCPTKFGRVLPPQLLWNTQCWCLYTYIHTYIHAYIHAYKNTLAVLY